MTSPPIRILFLADTHLGLDHPTRARVERRRRGPDFFDAFDRALEPALRDEVDLVIHGGDLFHRSRVRDEIVLMALDRVRAVTERGIPFVIVPGNHERSQLPLGLIWRTPRVIVLDHPSTHVLEIRGKRLALSGFPFSRERLPEVFPRLVEETEWSREPADARLLCIHQTVAGATVGPIGYTFRAGRDVIPGRLIPGSFAAVLSGHIHRAQVLRRDPRGRALSSPVLYPGSTERTAFAEKDERKGHLILRVTADGGGGRLTGCEFREIPTRPMTVVEIDTSDLSHAALERCLREELGRQPADGVVRVRITGRLEPEAAAALRAEALRSCAPATMTVDLRFAATAGPGSPANQH